MFTCVKNNVDFVLVGSIRDDGPLPDVITDAVEAQKAMRAKLEGVTIALMMGTMLAFDRGWESAARDRENSLRRYQSRRRHKAGGTGAFQAVGLVTDIEPFLRELTDCIAAHSLAATGMRKLLLCPPDHYGIEYEINPWMSRDRGADKPLVQAQWNGLFDTLSKPRLRRSSSSRPSRSFRTWFSPPMPD